MKVKCPTCKKIVEYSVQNAYRPFCSERCQTLDLGAWADERFAIPVTCQDIESVNDYSGPDHGEEHPLPPKHHLN